MEQGVLKHFAELSDIAAKNNISDLSITIKEGYVQQGPTKLKEIPVTVETKAAYNPTKEDTRRVFVKYLMERLVPYSGIGDQFKTYFTAKLKGKPWENVNTVSLKSMEVEQIMHTPGQVNLVIFWTSWSQESVAIIEQIEKSSINCRAIGISLDDSPKKPQVLLKEKDWTKVEHYWPEAAEAGNFKKLFNIQGVPLCVLIDKSGIIQFAGHPAGVNLGASLEKLMNDESVEYANEPSNKLKNPSYTFESFKNDLSEVTTIHDTTLHLLKNVFIAAIYSKTFKGDAPADINAFLVLRFEYPQKAKPAVDSFVETVNHKFASNLNIGWKIKAIPSTEFGEKCDKCGCSLINSDHYCCGVCRNPPICFCYNCVASVKSPELPHPHGLYFIQKDSEKRQLEELKQGKGQMENRLHTTCKCDCCGNTPKGIRWKCAICPNVDICDECFEMARNPPSEVAYEKMAERAAKLGHDMKTHIYIRQEFVDFIELPYQL
eukprot:TRINITY_DN3427_c0_g1_i1.p1 TRINITY_DN3427_c0_g1~~TRINITY_DN3427_c0_g1_i1.p1  ORF type:complete len:520 (-),score=48.34 TRINITY_DN3427_c0_g1_i1:86-1552(-)